VQPIKVGDRLELVPLTRNGKNLLQERGGACAVLRVEDKVICYGGRPGALLRFDTEPKRPRKAIEEQVAHWHAFEPTASEEWMRNFLYRTEFDLWIEIPSKDFEIRATV
jgi:hypothetical protein